MNSIKIFNHLLHSILLLLIKSFMFFSNKLFGVNQNKAVFISFYGKSYSDNPRAISEKLHEIQPNYKIIWLFNNPAEKKSLVPNYVKCIKRRSLAGYFHLATAKVWVDNFPKSYSNYKSKEQIYIQTWHGDRGFKTVLYDSPFKEKNSKYIESDICDLMLSGSDFCDRVYRSAFRYNGGILKAGSPRCDILINKDDELAAKIKKQLGIRQKCKVLLYAPTFRKKAAVSRNLQPLGNINLSDILNLLEKKTKDEWICLVRAHSAVQGLSGISENEKIIDVTKYEDMNELLLVSDILITDYSSSAGDFALLRRPIFLYQEDREEYLKHDRNFYFDLDQSPFWIARSQRELEEMIENLDFQSASKNCDQILEFYGTVETGQASRRVVEYILEKSR